MFNSSWMSMRKHMSSELPSKSFTWDQLLLLWLNAFKCHKKPQNHGNDQCRWAAIYSSSSLPGGVHPLLAVRITSGATLPSGLPHGWIRTFEIPEMQGAWNMLQQWSSTISISISYLYHPISTYMISPNCTVLVRTYKETTLTWMATYGHGMSWLSQAWYVWAVSEGNSVGENGVTRPSAISQCANICVDPATKKY